MLLLLTVLCCGICNALTTDDGTAYVIGLLPEPVYSNTSYPNTENTQTIKIGLTNYDESSKDVSFHAYLPDYAEMTSFSMSTNGLSYKGKKTSHEEAHKVLQEARDRDHDAAMIAPRSMSELYDNEIQTAATTVHIKANKQMIFDLEYKETLKDMQEAQVKILNRARVSLNLYGSRAEHLAVELNSPNYPDDYPSSADITWLVRAPESNVLELYVGDLDMEECCDRLTVYDGWSKNQNVLCVLTGSIGDIAASSFRSTSNSMLLHLTSDCSVSMRGFKVAAFAYEQLDTSSPVAATTQEAVVNSTQPVNGLDPACNGGDHVGGFYGSIQSPNYPSPYENNMHCSWTIQIPYYGYKVGLTFSDFHLESGHDFLHLYDGYSASDPLLTTMTGGQSGTFIVSSSNHLYLLFTSDWIDVDKGFSLYFSYIDQQLDTTAPAQDETTGSWGSGGSGGSGDSEGCSAVEYLQAYSSYSYFNSPNYPNFYYNNLACSWSIKADLYQYKVHAFVVDLDLEANYDYLAFYDGSSVHNTQLALLTGRYNSFDVESTASNLFIQFTTDYSVTKCGFRVGYNMF